MNLTMHVALMALATFQDDPGKPLKITATLQDAQAEYRSQLLGEAARPVGEGLTLGGIARPARLDEKGRLEIDVRGDGKFQTLSRPDTISFPTPGEGEKRKSVNLKIAFLKNESGAWLCRNLTQLTLKIGGEQFVVVDADVDGSYDDAGADGMAWQGQTWLFPLPAADERWCSATMELTGLAFGPLGERPAVRGRPLATTVPAALPILKGVNEERVKLGLTPRPEDPALSRELQQHCRYMALNNVLTHPEESGRSGYSKEGHDAGMRSILSQGSPAERIAAGMVQTYFHRQDVIRPGTIAFGVALDGAFGGIDGRTSMASESKAGWPVLCPVPDQREVELTYGKEMPDACPGDPAAGTPITAYFGTPELKLNSFSLKALVQASHKGPIPPKAGTVVECYAYDPKTGASSDFTGYQRCVCIIAKEPLKPATLYEVTMEVGVAGAPWKRTWRFATVAGGGGRAPAR